MTITRKRTAKGAMRPVSGGRDRPSGLAAWLLLPLLAVFGSAKADYVDEWGPELGSTLPLLEAYDQNGTLRSLDNLTGNQGLLLFLNRSADW